MASSTASIPTSTPTPPTTSGPSNALVIFLRFMTMGVIISAIAYGIVFTLSVMTFWLLHKTSLNSKKRIHYILFSFILFMFTLSTINIVEAIHMTLKSISTQTRPRNLEVGKNASAVVIVLVTWASDGFLLWRAGVLYEGVGAVWRKVLHSFVVLLMLVQSIAGILYFLSNFVASLGQPRYSRPIFIGFALTTLSINWIITAFVVGRLLYFRGKVSRSLGPNYGTPFGRIISMCVESAVLIIVFSTLFLVQNIRNSKRNPFSFSRILLTNIYVIGPLLILYRVAQGKAFLSSSTSFYSVPGQTSSQRSTTLRFNDHTKRTGTSTGHSTKIEVNITDEVHKDFYDREHEMELGGLGNPIKGDVSTHETLHAS